jgi:hypothetical protein
VNWVPTLAVLAVAAAPIGAVAAPAVSAPRVHVLADRVDPGAGGDERRLTVVVEDGGDCVAAAHLEVGAPFAATAMGACAVALTGPAEVTPEVSMTGARLRLPPRMTAAAREPLAPAPGAPTRGATWLVTPTGAVPVGHVATAAALWVSLDGEPSSDVDLNVRAEGARVRALRWRQPGVGAIDLLVPAYTPTIELVIQDRGGGETRTTLAVDPGPPVDATVTVGAALAGRPFAVDVEIATSSGARFEGEHRLSAAGCVAEDHQLTCPRPGPTLVIVSVAYADRWVPLAHARVDVAPPPTTTTTTTTPPPPPRPRSPRPRLGWEVAARGAAASDGLRSAGLFAGAVRRLGPRLDATLGLGWQFGAASLTPVAPVEDALVLSEHHVELRGGLVARVARDAPWSLRVAAGPVAVRQRGEISDGGWLCTGVRAQALAAVGVRVGLGPRALTIELGARATTDVRALDWPRPDRQAYLEVGLASAR